MTLTEEDLSRMNLSFAGCGFLCIYHAGVCAAIKEYAPQLTRNRICGASAGAIAAAGLLCNVCMSKATSTILAVVSQARAGSLRALSPNFDLMGLVRRGLESSLPADAHTTCNGRLFISMTRARDYKNVVISEFRTREELIQAIMCSSFIPFYCGRYPPKYRGEAYIDGGFSDNQPQIDPHTISVSPFSGESDICPTDNDSASLLGFSFCGTSVQFTTANMYRMMVILFPPSQEVCSRICRQGFEDTLHFLTKQGIVPCARCLTIQSNVLLPSGMTTTPIPVTTAIKSATATAEKKGRMKRIQSFPAAISTTKRKLGECERCSANRDPRIRPVFTNVPLPTSVQKTLDDAAAAESGLFKYLRSFRLYRWTMRLMTPVFLPFELFIYSLRTMQAWLHTLGSGEFYLQRLQQLIDFFLAEVDKRRLMSEPLPASCRVAITNVDEMGGISTTEFYGKDEGEEQEETDGQKLPFTSHVTPSRKPSMTTGAHIAPSRKPSMSSGAIKQVIDYGQQHEAVLAFHYTDEDTNEVQVCEIFDVINAKKSRPGHPTPAESRNSMGTFLDDDDNGNDNAAEDKNAAAGRQDASCSPIPDRHEGAQTEISPPGDEDDGDTTTSISSSGGITGHSGHTGGSSLLSTPQQRRHTVGGSRRSLYSQRSAGSGSGGGHAGTTARKLGVAASLHPNFISSDSEDLDGSGGGGHFFVVNRRKGQMAAATAEKKKSDSRAYDAGEEEEEDGTK